MKRLIIFAAAAMLFTGCSFLKNTSSTSTSSAASAPAVSTSTATTDALTAGQGAGNALLNLYNQYKADGKYDYTNIQNALNTVTLLANCEGLKSNYKNSTYLKDFGKGMIASSLGLVSQNNVEAVTNSLISMVKDNEAVQQTTAKAQSTASTAAEYANTAAQYAGALGSLLSMFGN